ncbi:MAG: hypothetical protein ACE5KU_01375 [Nitrososphaerales archaeon]
MNKVKSISILILVIAVISAASIFMLGIGVPPVDEKDLQNEQTTTTTSSRARINKFFTVKDGFNLTAELNLRKVHFAGDIYLKISLTNIENTSKIVDPIVGFDVRDSDGAKVYGFKAHIYGNDSQKTFKIGESWTSSKGLHWKAMEDPILRVDIIPGTYSITVYSTMHDSDKGRDFQLSIKDITVIVTE